MGHERVKNADTIRQLAEEFSDQYHWDEVEVLLRVVLARTAKRFEILAREYDSMPSGRGYAGCDPSTVAIAIREVIKSGG